MTSDYSVHWQTLCVMGDTQGVGRGGVDQWLSRGVGE